MDGCENSLQRQVIHTFVKEVFLWDNHAVIVLTLNNTQETVTFEEIREFEQFSDETQEPLPDESESGSCNIRFGSPDWTWTSDTLINSQVLLPTELRRNIETQQVFDLLCLFRCRRLSIFPDSCPSSIVDASELNYCVRNGNRWTLTAIGTDCMRENSQN